MISASAARTSSWCTPLIVPCVPTGMKAGVRTTPCAVLISPARAAPSVAISRNENGSGIAALMAAFMAAFVAAYLAEQQASVAIGVEAVVACDGVVIGAAHYVEATKCADQHEQSRTRQMKIRQHRVDRAEAITGRNEQSRLAGKGRERAVRFGGALEEPQ